LDPSWRAGFVREIRPVQPQLVLLTANVPWKPPEGLTTIAVHASRGLEPRVATRLTSAAEPSARMESMRRR
jgi:hypothetical protein